MIDFIDLGCGVGGSIEWAQSRFGGVTHLGIDNREIEVETAIKSGFNAIVGDVTTNDIKLPQSRYITMLHFLEHLNDDQCVEAVIKKSIEAASEFIFIKVPFFDGIEYLKNKGFKLTWTDWVGHPTAVTTELLRNIINKFNLQYKIGYLYPILDSNSKEIIPLSAPCDTIVYDLALGKKEFKTFNNIYRETYCFINVNSSSWNTLINTNIL